LKKLALRASCFFVATALETVALAITIFLQPPNWRVFAAISLSAVVITGFLFVKTKMGIKAAQLIIENQILHIQPAIFMDTNESIEVYVSCFGILLESKIIKFNQEGIRLKGVQLGRDYITLTYGTNRRMQSTKLIYAEISEDTLQEIVRRFHYETGIVPVITH
jgi:hypothetical protein